MDQEPPPFFDKNAKPKPRRAAVYMRMGTEHQNYSVENQAAAISEYAVRHGIEIVANYESCL